MPWIEYTFFGITTVSAIFAVYRTFRDPDEEAKTRLAVMDERYTGLKAIVEKMATNDLPHLDALVRDVHTDIASVKQDVTRLATIIEERIPKK